MVDRTSQTGIEPCRQKIRLALLKLDMNDLGGVRMALNEALIVSRRKRGPRKTADLNKQTIKNWFILNPEATPQEACQHFGVTPPQLAELL